ncbi:hypothetical protein HWA77_16810 [Photobacterium damselae subsp. damselae]|uniref:Uncharacterized protein n=1 Tax=Photobacterium damselae subsp. damselae TaxID=85581 RepID=A0A850QQG8_PHODD|nr:hypothetical protein [Photobacterium damselae subsp. damselae]
MHDYLVAVIPNFLFGGLIISSVLGFAISFICPPDDNIAAENLRTISTITLLFSVSGFAVYYS